MRLKLFKKSNQKPSAKHVWRSTDTFLDFIKVVNVVEVNIPLSVFGGCRLRAQFLSMLFCLYKLIQRY